MQTVYLHEISKPIFWEKYQSLFSGKNKKSIVNFSPAELAHSVVTVKEAKV